MQQLIKYTLTFVLLLSCTIVSSQAYTEDSLQIKAYTEIKFIDGAPQDIVLKKVFCDYCSENQMQLLGEDAIRRTEIEKYNPKNKLKNGLKKIAVYIRISKTDFAAIKENK
ncbi:hypothetical protein [Lacinutrix chionoecetis]